LKKPFHFWEVYLDFSQKEQAILQGNTDFQAIEIWNNI